MRIRNSNRRCSSCFQCCRAFCRLSRGQCRPDQLRHQLLHHPYPRRYPQHRHRLRRLAAATRTHQGLLHMRTDSSKQPAKRRLVVFALTAIAALAVIPTVALADEGHVHAPADDGAAPAAGAQPTPPVTQPNPAPAQPTRPRPAATPTPTRTPAANSNGGGAPRSDPVQPTRRISTTGGGGHQLPYTGPGDSIHLAAVGLLGVLGGMLLYLGARARDRRTRAALAARFQWRTLSGPR
jgi:hypothetical protein